MFIIDYPSGDKGIEFNNIKLKARNEIKLNKL